MFSNIQVLIFRKYQAHPAIDQTAYMVAWDKYNKTACTSLPEDGHLDVRNMSKTLYKGADKSLARPGRKQATETEDFEFHISYL